MSTRPKERPTRRRWLRVVFAVACVAGLLAVAAFPSLAAISSRAPKLVEVPGATVRAVGSGSMRFERTGGAGEALLFLHGFNSQLSVWDTVWPRIDGCGQAIRIDIPGYGGSTWSTDSFTLPDQAARIIAFLDALDISRVTLVGVSMGASLSAWIAARYPDRVKAVMLMAPSGYPDSLQYGGRVRFLYRAGMLNQLAAWIASSSVYRSQYPTSRALQALSVTRSYGAPWAEALDDIRAPTLVVWSRGDDAVPFRFADRVVGSIERAVLLPLSRDVGHDVTERRPELVGELACLLHAGVAPAEAVKRARPLHREGDG